MLYGDLDHGRPNDQRGFLHKKLFGAVKKVAGILPIPAFASTVIGAVAGKLAGRVQQKQAGLQAKFPELSGLTTTLPSPVPRTSGRTGFRPPTQFQLHDQSQQPCLPPLIRGPQGLCIAPTSPLGASRLVGQATMGRYGAALIPGSLIVDRAVCLPGMQISQITNSFLLAGNDTR